MGRKRNRHSSTVKRMEMIRKLADEFYEEGNQSKCYASVWRSKIFPQYGICYRTFLNYVHYRPERNQSAPGIKQQTLFPNES